MHRWHLAAIVCVICAAQPLRAQAPVGSEPARVYLDCPIFSCDQDFIRTEISFVSWVRDRAVADVHVLVTQQGTGGGGTEYTLAFFGQQRFASMGDTVKFVAPQSSTADEIRRGMTRTLKLGLVPFLSRTDIAPRLNVVYAAPTAGAVTVESFAGVGYPFAAGTTRPGDVVLDVGSGSGTDVLIASGRVGLAGKVLALDMTPAMREKLRVTMKKMGVTNLQILDANAEEIPLLKACVRASDHVASRHESGVRRFGGSYWQDGAQAANVGRS